MLEAKRERGDIYLRGIGSENHSNDLSRKGRNLFGAAVTPFLLKSSLRWHLFTKNVRSLTNVKIYVQHCKLAVYLWGVFEFIATENQVFSVLTTNKR